MFITHCIFFFNLAIQFKFLFVGIPVNLNLSMEGFLFCVLKQKLANTKNIK